MAITGTGTQADPFLVHSYDEIKSKVNSRPTSKNNKYIKLVNDINFKDYGDNWLFNEIDFGGSWDIDLGDHTIKNIILGNGVMFYSNENADCVIRNGKILNIFASNSPQSIMNGNTYSNLSLYNLSISIYGRGFSRSIFRYVNMYNSAIYYKDYKMTCAEIIYSSYVENSDFYLDINNINNRYIQTGSNCYDCRIRGKFGGTVPNGWLGEFCGVIEIETTASSTMLSSYPSEPTIYNHELAPNIKSEYGIIPCTSNQMRDVDYLNSVGFIVAKAGE